MLPHGRMRSNTFQLNSPQLHPHLIHKREEEELFLSHSLCNPIQNHIIHPEPERKSCFFINIVVI